MRKLRIHAKRTTKPITEAPEPIVPDAEAPVCITPDCANPMRWKSLCSHCYGQAKELIDAGRTTWPALYELDLALDDRPFMIAFAMATTSPAS